MCLSFFKSNPAAKPFFTCRKQLKSPPILLCHPATSKQNRAWREDRLLAIFIFFLFFYWISLNLLHFFYSLTSTCKSFKTSPYFCDSWQPPVLLCPVLSGIAPIRSKGAQMWKAVTTSGLNSFRGAVNVAMAFGLCPPVNVQDSECCKRPRQSDAPAWKAADSCLEQINTVNWKVSFSGCWVSCWGAGRRDVHFLCSSAVSFVVTYPI